jgi:hypothetical protein
MTQIKSVIESLITSSQGHNLGAYHRLTKMHCNMQKTRILVKSLARGSSADCEPVFISHFVSAFPYTEACHVA